MLTCRQHPDSPSATTCAECRAPLCEACSAFWVDEKIACRPCAWGAAREGRPRWDLAGAFILAGVGAEWALVATERTMRWGFAFAVIAGLAMLAIAAYLIFPKGAKRAVRPRDMGPAPLVEVTAAAGPYRHARVLVPAVRAPGFSGRLTATFLFGTFAATAFALPFSLRLPRWIEIELVLGVWAVLLFGVLAAFLFRGFVIEDDHQLRIDFGRTKRARVDPAGAAPTRERWKISALDVFSGASDAEGCLWAVLLLVLIGVVFAAAFLLVELVVPLVFFLAYWLLVRAVRRVMQDRHDCAGRLGRSFAWASVWTLVYFGPFAGLVWAVHAIARARAVM